MATKIGFKNELQPEERAIRIGPVQNPDGNGPCKKCAFFLACGQDSCLSAPLQVGQEIIGSVCVVRDSDNPFNGNDRRALGLLGSSAAVAILNARLSAESQYRVQQDATRIERERLAAELHDSLGQTLSYLNLRVNRARKLVDETEPNGILAEIEGIKTVTNTAYGQVRSALGGLKAQIPLEGGSSYQDLMSFISEFRKVTSLPVDAHVDRMAIQALAPLVQQQVLYIVREAMTNIHRHARASQVKVAVIRDDCGVRFAVEDDGIGFDPDQVDGQTHLGVSIMQARARRCQGDLNISSELGQGTRIVACFTLNQKGT